MPPSRESYERLKRSISTASIDTAGLEDHRGRPELRKNPQELHWRTHGPCWTGNLEGAWSGKYGHLEGEIYCRHCGAIPCPLDHDEEGRIRLRDLEFVRDIVKEKKEVEKKQTELELEMRSLLAATEGWRGEKVMDIVYHGQPSVKLSLPSRTPATGGSGDHRQRPSELLEEIKLGEKRKQEWDFERGIMEAELNRLKGINDKQLNQLANCRKDQQQIQTLTERVEDLEGENEQLVTETQRVRQLLVSQMADMERTRKDSRRLVTELEDAGSSIRVLRFQLAESNETRSNVQRQLDSRAGQMERFEDEITSLIRELEIKENKDGLSQRLVSELRRQIVGMKTRLEDSEKYQSDLQEQINAYMREIERLQYKLGHDKRFQKFVEIKRECNDLKTQNETLLHRVHLVHAHSIPLLNAEGRVTSPTGRPATALRMRRAKSATAFTSNERLYAIKKIRTTLRLEDLPMKNDGAC